MKKLIGLLIALLLLAGGSWYIYDQNYGGDTYYTKITATGDETKEIDSRNGQNFTIYHYSQKAYTKEGKETRQKMDEARDKPLQIGAYLKLKVNDRKGVLSWEEVQEEDVPKKALEEIQKDS